VLGNFRLLILKKSNKESLEAAERIRSKKIIELGY
jgi:hypothetical protein